MYVKKILLSNFRNIESLKLEPSPKLNVLYGNNAQGKTNFIEGIYLCATGRSHRHVFDSELIKFGEDEAHLQVVVEDFSTEKIDVHLRKYLHKGIAINNVPIKKLGDLFGVLIVVIFSPEDLQLIKSNPGERRKFMDMELCQLSKVYYYELKQYYQILKQRNKFLKFAGKTPDLDILATWDEQLVLHGTKVINHREKFINELNVVAKQIHSQITNQSEELEIIYKPNVSAEEFMQRLCKKHDYDISVGSTSVGIHKDDIIFMINGNNARIFGSQGQQRTISLVLKLSEIELIKSITDRTPVLILDDVLSELDESRQNFVLKKINEVQTFVTCTGTIPLTNCEANMYNVENGQVKYLRND